jgi:hypothetical protein
MPIWVPLKFGVKEKHDSFDLLTKNKPNPFRIFGEKIKTSPIGKFLARVVKGAANSNSLTNSSYGRDANCQGRFKWFPRSYLDVRDMCSIFRSSIMNYFKRHLSQ